MATTEEKKYLVHVEDNLQEYAKNAAEARKKLDEMAEANKAVRKNTEATAEEIEASNAALRAAKKEYNAATQTLDKMTVAQKANATSYEGLKAQWMAAERNLKTMEGTLEKNVDGSYRLTDAYRKQRAAVDESKKALDSFGQGIHNNTLNVGNYTQGVTEAIKQTGLFGHTFSLFGNVSGMFATAKGAVMNLAASFKTLKAAIASTGIGLLIIALGSLLTWFNKSAEGSKIMKQGMAAVGQVMETLIGTLTKAGKLLADLFTGDWSKLKQDVQNIGDEWKNIGKNMKEAAAIAKEELSIGKAKREWMVTEAGMLRDISKLKLSSADKTKTDLERTEALTKMLGLEHKMAQDKIKLLDKELQVSERIVKLKESHGVKASADEKNRVAELTAAKINAEAAEYDRSKKATAQLSALRLEFEARIFKDKKARLEAEQILAGDNFEKLKKNLIDNYKLDITQAELTKNQKWLLRVQLNKAIEELEKKQREKIKKYDTDYVDFLTKLNEDLLASDQKFNEDMLNQSKSNAADRLEVKRIEADGDLLILRDILDEEYDMMLQSEEYKQASNDRKALIDAQYADQRKKIDEDIANHQKEVEKKAFDVKMQTFAATADLLGNMSELLNKNTLIGKSLAIAQATINTYVAASQALASAPNPIVGAIQMAAAIAMGLVQVKQIMAVKVSKTGAGGSAGGGSGSVVSSSFTAANQSLATSNAQTANSDRLGQIQQNANNQASARTAAQTTAQAISERPIKVELSVEAFEAKAAEKRQVEVRSNI